MTELANREKLNLSDSEMAALVKGHHGNPFAALGPHLYDLDGTSYLVIRAFIPTAREMQVKVDNKLYQMDKVHNDGLFQVALAGQPQNLSYQLAATDHSDRQTVFHDPYAFSQTLTDYDLHLIKEGNHFHTYDKLGAHLTEQNGVKGVAFAVWAPNALRVSIIGDFNSWDGRVLPMRNHPSHGIHEMFVPGLVEGTVYKYEVRSNFTDYPVEKSDPYGFFSEVRPQTASIVTDLDRYEWQDQAWSGGNRAKRNALGAPISIYEVHLGSWRRRWGASGHDESYMSYRELADQLVDYVKDMGFSHIELLPVSEHPFDGSWGYQTIGYFAATSRFGPPQDLMYLIDRCHQNNIGVFLDWVPAHFPKDQHGLALFDGTHLYEHADPRQGEHADWGTLIFNFGRHEVRNFLISNALFWLDKYHIDGLRVDAVASLLYLDYSREPGQWVSNQYGGRENLEAIDFIRRFNELVHLEYPETLTSAEDSTAWPMVTKPTFLGGLGFDLKWNMGWMHDMLDYMVQDPIYRRYHHNSLTFSLMYAFNENYVLPFSHDEVVHLKKSLLDKMPGDAWQKFANLRAIYGYMYTHPGKKLLFMGGEFGQWKEWNERTALDWDLLNYPSHRGMQKYVQTLNRLYESEPALYEVDDSWEGFQWLELRDNENSTLAFLRRAKDPDNELIIALNFTPVPRQNYRIGVPKPGYYQEILNSDSSEFWGNDVGNLGGVQSEDMGWGGHFHSLNLTIPPLGMVILRSPRQS
ncbi:MAG: glgB [Chloroflexi bacterium]|nr:glgB [Chloroflexota bacterium]